MKQYYESEVLFQLMERDGFNIPSSVPPYEAEIKAYLINQVKQAYPKLTDYEAEWLLYNYTKHLPADFPISSVSNVTEASFENVVPFAYQSAILKGNTLINLCNLPKRSDTLTSSSRFFFCKIMKPLKANTTYTMFATITNSTISKQIRLEIKHSDGSYTYPLLVGAGKSGIVKTPIVSEKEITSVSFYIQDTDTGQATISDVMIIEGDYTNVDIPYFEGMQSVKMPVLTTVGKNLFDGFSNVIEENGEYSLDGVNRINLFTTKLILKANKTVTISYEIKKHSDFSQKLCLIYGNNEILMSQIKGIDWVKQNIAITPETDCVLNFGMGTTANIYGYSLRNIQIEEGSSATPYEPYKSNILTVNEDIELRGIGDVRDELDCLTGEVVKRIEETDLNGGENWILNVSKEQPNHWCFNNNQSLAGKKLLISDKFPQSDIDGDRESIRGGGDYIFVYISKEKVDGKVSSFKQWLSQNPITVQYELAQESVKTVDLTTVNDKGETTYFMPLEGTMNVQSSGEIIKPTFDMSVPVEATTQNLASFIELEMRSDNHE